MNKLLVLSPFLIILGCAQFGGIESESKKGIIPEIMILTATSEPSDKEVAEYQAQYYTAQTRSLYFQNIAESSVASPMKKAYRRKALKAKEMALAVEEKIQ